LDSCGQFIEGQRRRRWWFGHGRRCRPPMEAVQKALVLQGKMCPRAIEALKKRKIPGFFNRAVQKGLFFPHIRLLSPWSESKEL